MIFLVLDLEIFQAMPEKMLPCCGDRTEKDPSSKYSECAPSCTLDGLMRCFGALSEKNSVSRKNSDKTLCLEVEFEFESDAQCREI